MTTEDAFSEESLPYLSATEAVAAFRARQLSPVELMRAVIARAGEVNGAVNAITVEFFDRAMEQAREAEGAYSRDPEGARPLEGIPIALKDTTNLAGELTTAGSVALKDFRPERSAPTNERLLDAGAIVHMRTTTPEFGFAGTTRSRLWGTTRNPWNLNYSPGGSSGGAAAAVAAGMTTIADGSDGGGSVRIPSSMCGLFGYKPPAGRNPQDPDSLPSEFMITVGPLTRTVADAALMQNVMSGQHPRDLHSLRDRVNYSANVESLAGTRVALSHDLGYFDVSHEVRANTIRTAEVLSDLGCVVEEVDLGWNGDMYDAWLTTWEGIFWGLCGEHLAVYRDDMDPAVVEVLERGSRLSLKDFHHVNRIRADGYQKLSAVLDSHDILIAPTLAVPAVPADQDLQADDFRIDGRLARDFTRDGRDHNAYNSWQMTYPFNVINTVPVASIPSGIAESVGIPTGLQIVGPAYDDAAVFRTAAAFEAAAPWRGLRPDVDRLRS